MVHDPPIAPDPHIELVPVFRSGDQGHIVLAKSLLESEGIDYLVRGEGLQDLFGLGRLAVGFSNVVGPAEFLVRRADGERARELLCDLPQ
jgi:hypothetical protein